MRTLGPHVEVRLPKPGDVVTLGTDNLYLVLSTTSPRDRWACVTLLDLQTGRRDDLPAVTDSWVMERLEP